ncbi:MAG: hypothetical protein MH825_13665 [Cyanobacteria bacterium]|nr:hypothetical protein [Cyanobacteriota bacterium]
MRHYTSTLLTSLALTAAIASTGAFTSASASAAEVHLTADSSPTAIATETYNTRQKRPSYRGSGRREIMRFLATDTYGV